VNHGPDHRAGHQLELLPTRVFVILHRFGPVRGQDVWRATEVEVGHLEFDQALPECLLGLVLQQWIHCQVDLEAAGIESIGAVTALDLLAGHFEEVGAALDPLPVQRHAQRLCNRFLVRRGIDEPELEHS